MLSAQAAAPTAGGAAEVAGLAWSVKAQLVERKCLSVCVAAGHVLTWPTVAHSLLVGGAVGAWGQCRRSAPRSASRLPRSAYSREPCARLGTRDESLRLYGLLRVSSTT